MTARELSTVLAQMPPDTQVCIGDEHFARWLDEVVEGRRLLYRGPDGTKHWQSLVRLVPSRTEGP